MYVLILIPPNNIYLRNSILRVLHWKDVANIIIIYCTARDCGPLLVPTNGSSQGDLTVFPNMIMFDCDEGFILKGSRVRLCQENGTWGGNVTYCEGSTWKHHLTFLPILVCEIMQY